MTTEQFNSLVNTTASRIEANTSSTQDTTLLGLGSDLWNTGKALAQGSMDIASLGANMITGTTKAMTNTVPAALKGLSQGIRAEMNNVELEEIQRRDVLTAQMSSAQRDEMIKVSAAESAMALLAMIKGSEEPTAKEPTANGIIRVEEETK